jgi:tripartite-type tricarboxylate transporter receptor subunit TctC
MSRPFLAPPAIPPAQASILTQAFMQAHQDADYLREAKEMQLDVSPLKGDDIAKLMTRIAQTPPAVIARYKATVNSN